MAAPIGQDCGGMSLTSLYYWLAVVALAVLVAAAFNVVGQDRVERRVYRAALGFYLLAWLAFGTITASPLFFGSLNVMPNGWPPLWAGLPLAIVVGVVVVFIAGHLIAWLFGIRSLLLHPRHLREAWSSGRHPASKPSLTEEELRAAEAYDAEWQLQDRERNRRLGIGPSL
jgi:hypothetical protein